MILAFVSVAWTLTLLTTYETIILPKKGLAIPANWKKSTWSAVSFVTGDRVAHKMYTH